MSADFHEVPQTPDQEAEEYTAAPTGLQSPIVSLLLVLGLFVGFALVVYVLHRAGFGAAMIYDARGWIQNKAHVFGQHDLRAVIAIVPARPLFMFSLYVNYLLSGMDPAAFRITNALIVAATGVSLVLLSITVLGAVDRSSSEDRRLLYGVGLFLGLTFIVHPLQTFTVLYIWQREAILACFFYYSGLAAYLASRSGRLERAPGVYVLTGLCFLAGLLTKENVATLPVALVLAELILFPQDRKELLKNIFRIAAFTVPAFAVYVLVSLYAQGAESVHTASIGRRLAEYYEDAGINALSVALTETRVLLSYLGMILAPAMAGLPMLRAEIVSTSIVDPPITLLAVLGMIGLVALGIALVRRRPATSFGILFFVVASLPEALLLPQYLFCGYRAILPMAGVLIVLGDVLVSALMMLRRRVPSQVLISACVIVALLPLAYLAMVTNDQAKRWQPLLFWKNAFESLPQFSDRVAYRPYSDILSNYGLELVASGNFPAAVAVLKRAVDMELSAEPALKAVTEPPHAADFSDPVADARANLRIRGTRGSKVAALINLGQAWQQSGNLAEAKACFDKAVHISPRSAIAHSALAGALKESGSLDEAIRHYRQAITLDPQFAVGYNGLGLAVEESGNITEAISLYRKAAEISPGLAEAHNNLGTALEKTGRVVEALDQYQQAITCNPELAQAHNNLGVLLRRLGKVQESIEHHRAAIGLNPSSALAYSNLGAALEAAGNREASLASFRKAVALQPDLPAANYALADALLRSGKTEEAVTYLRKAVKLNPKFLEAYANLGIALLGMGRVPEAVQSLKQAVALDNNAPGLHNALGVALAQSGQRSEAVEHFTRAMQLDPKDERAKQNLQRILKETEASSHSGK